ATDRSTPTTTTRATRAGTSVAFVRPQLAADFPTLPPGRVHVRVREAGTNGFHQLLERGWLARIDSLSGGSDDVGGRHRPGDAAGRGRAWALAAAAAEEDRDAAVDAACPDM